MSLGRVAFKEASLEDLQEAGVITQVEIDPLTLPPEMAAPEDVQQHLDFIKCITHYHKEWQSMYPARQITMMRHFYMSGRKDQNQADINKFSEKVTECVKPAEPETKAGQLNQLLNHDKAPRMFMKEVEGILDDAELNALTKKFMETRLEPQPHGVPLSEWLAKAGINPTLTTYEGEDKREFGFSKMGGDADVSVKRETFTYEDALAEGFNASTSQRGQLKSMAYIDEFTAAYENSLEHTSSSPSPNVTGTIDDVIRENSADHSQRVFNGTTADVTRTSPVSGNAADHNNGPVTEINLGPDALNRPEHRSTLHKVKNMESVTIRDPKSLKPDFVGSADKSARGSVAPHTDAPVVRAKGSVSEVDYPSVRIQEMIGRQGLSSKGQDTTSMTDDCDTTIVEETVADFLEGQWWVQELDKMVAGTKATADQKRAVAVVHNMLKRVLEENSRHTLEAHAAANEPEELEEETFDLADADEDVAEVREDTDINSSLWKSITGRASLYEMIKADGDNFSAKIGVEIELPKNYVELKEMAARYPNQVVFEHLKQPNYSVFGGALRISVPNQGIYSIVCYSDSNEFLIELPSLGFHQRAFNTLKEAIHVLQKLIANWNRMDEYAIK